MKKIIKNKSEILFLIIILIGFIFVRSLHFSYFLNWSQDQADSALSALNIWREKKLTLIGPQISATYQGRLLFQGPITTYLFLLFLLLGSWEPIRASYFFVIFASLMIFPLYYGMKKITNKKMAITLVFIYSFFPYYLNYTRFLWNSTLQFASLPIFIFFLAQYKKDRKLRNLFFVSFLLGLLTQFHYQFVLIILFFFIYFIFYEKSNFLKFSIIILGIALGLLPLIIFELKHNFYNIKTAFLFLKNWEKVDKPGNLTMPHYYLSISFLLLTFSFIWLKNWLKKINYYLIILFGIILFCFSFFLNYKKPIQSYWAPAKFWNYLMEEKAYQIIKESKIKKDFNVADLSYYNTTATVIKYLLKRDYYQINYDDYYQNRYLFVISRNNDYEKTLSYEVAFFKPRRLIKKWSLNDYYQLYLFKREEK